MFQISINGFLGKSRVRVVLLCIPSLLIVIREKAESMLWAGGLFVLEDDYALYLLCDNSSQLGSCATDMGVGDLKGEIGGKGMSQRI